MITEEHRIFARQVVALAREHGMNHLQMKFDSRSSSNYLKHNRAAYGASEITLVWEEGRHAVPQNIRLDLHCNELIKESLC